MFDFLFRRMMLIMMAPDGGDAGSGATPPADTSTPPAGTPPADTTKPAGQDTPPANPPTDQPPKPALPKYSSQLSPAKARERGVPEVPLQARGPQRARRRLCSPQQAHGEVAGASRQGRKARRR